jgi:four helix bundle protein
MAEKVKKFEDLRCWQLAREIVRKIYGITSKGSFAKDFSLRDQVRRAAISIISNISEGFDRHSKKEFVQFLYIARGSISEVKAQLYVALDLGYLDQGEFSGLYEKLSECAGTIFNLIKSLSK